MNLTSKAREARQARRDARRALYQSCLSDAVSSELDRGWYHSRTADLWSFKDEDRGGRRKISGNPGHAAALFVSELFGDYDIHGNMRCFFGGMQREAGKGAHGITDGTIMVQVELTPLKGMVQRLDVPVTVKNGYMIQPGLFLNHGVPYVLAQSSIDDLITYGSFEEELRPDRKNMFSPPRK